MKKINDLITWQKLEKLRERIDVVDKKIVVLLANRFRITKSVGLMKKKFNLPSIDKKRERRQINSIKTIAKAEGLNPDFAKKILLFVINEVVKNHNKIKKS